MLDLLSLIHPQSIYSKTVVHQRAKPRNCWRAPPPQEAGLIATLSDGRERDTSQSRLPRGNGWGENILSVCEQVSPPSPILSTKAKSVQMIRAPALVRLYIPKALQIHTSATNSFVIIEGLRIVTSPNLVPRTDPLAVPRCSFLPMAPSNKGHTTSSPWYQSFPPIFT